MSPPPHAQRSWICSVSSGGQHVSSAQQCLRVLAHLCRQPASVGPQPPFSDLPDLSVQSVSISQISTAGAGALTLSPSVSSLCNWSFLTLLLEGLLVGEGVLFGLAVGGAGRYRLVVGAPGQAGSCQPFCVHLSPQGRWRTSCEPISVAACVLITSSYDSFPSPWALSESLGCLWFPNLYFWLGGSTFLS